MSKILAYTLSVAFITSTSFCAGGFEGMYGLLEHTIENKTDELPIIDIEEEEEDQPDSKWILISHVAQYKLADWSTCVGIAHNVTLDMAKSYAESNPDVSFFFYVKSHMVLENDYATPPFVRTFNQNDAVFFSGNPETVAHWGSADGLSDGYVKR